MVWAKPEYSKERVKRAGVFLIEDIEFLDEDYMDRLNEAFAVLNNWRASHGYPVNTFQATLRAKLKRLGIKATVAQRLKRTPSILSKLSLNPNMSLSRMQDIGGLRAVVPTNTAVYDLRDQFLASRFEHELVGDKDYIREPKPSGYRGIHLIYRYNNRKGEGPLYKGLQVEIQLRSKVQHSWATAVETAGLFLGQALKSSIGNARWLEFFAYASSAFAIMERTPVFEGHRDLTAGDVFNHVNQLEVELGVINSLNMYKAIVDYQGPEKDGSHYYLMRLDPAVQHASIKGFTRADLAKATEEYLAEERSVSDQPGSGVQVVLVAAQSLGALKRAYPNYFMDTAEFVARLKRIRKLVSPAMSSDYKIANQLLKGMSAPKTDVNSPPLAPALAAILGLPSGD